MNVFDVYIRNLSCIVVITEAVFYFRGQSDQDGLEKNSALLQWLPGVLDGLEENKEILNEHGYQLDLQVFPGIFTEIAKAQGQMDYLLLADLLEATLLPVLSQISVELYMTGLCEYDFWEENLKAIEKTDAELYQELIQTEIKVKQTELTNIGNQTLAVENETGRYYLHSNVNPYMERLIFADKYMKEEVTDYYVYGAGLGYHIYSFLENCSQTRVICYESDPEMIRTMLKYCNFSSQISSGNIKIVYDPDFRKLSKVLTDNTQIELIIHKPSIQNVKNKSMRDALQRYFLNTEGMRGKKSVLLAHNFMRNTKEYSLCVDGYKDDFAGKTVVIVAAGPSLDKNFMLLKEKREDLLIFATGTAMRKLVTAGIDVDYVIHIDPNERTGWKLANLDLRGRKVPLFLLSTATPLVPEKYRQETALIFQKDYPRAEKFAKEHGYQLYETGGSVSTTALDVAIKLGAKKCIFLGLDLAYTGNLAHASNTSNQQVDTKNMISIKAWDGTTVKTNNIFISYIQWFENYLKQHPEAEVIDATEGGAWIEGMKRIPFAQCFEE